MTPETHVLAIPNADASSMIPDYGATTTTPDVDAPAIPGGALAVPDGASPGGERHLGDLLEGSGHPRRLVCHQGWRRRTVRARAVHDKIGSPLVWARSSHTKAGFCLRCSLRELPGGSELVVRCLEGALGEWTGYRTGGDDMRCVRCDPSDETAGVTPADVAPAPHNNTPTPGGEAPAPGGDAPVPRNGAKALGDNAPAPVDDAPAIVDDLLFLQEVARVQMQPVLGFAHLAAPSQRQYVDSSGASLASFGMHRLMLASLHTHPARMLHSVEASPSRLQRGVDNIPTVRVPNDTEHGHETRVLRMLIQRRPSVAVDPQMVFGFRHRVSCLRPTPLKEEGRVVPGQKRAALSFELKQGDQPLVGDMRQGCAS